MKGGVARLRAVALISVGALVVHQLRFVLGYGRNAREALALQGHSYMPLAEALVVIFLVFAGLLFIRSLILARRGSPVASGGVSFSRLWAYASAALVAVYMLQEGFEGEFSAGHPAGLVGIFGQGGWTAVPLATAVGTLIALLLVGARRAIAIVSSRVRPALRRPEHARWHRLPTGFPELDALSQNLAARGPPLAS
jgi:hypothetical protein